MKKFTLVLALVAAFGIANAQRAVTEATSVNVPVLLTKTPTDTLYPDMVACGLMALYQGTTGYLVGPNNYGDLGKGQEYQVTSAYKIEGALYYFGAKLITGAADNVVFNVWSKDGTADCAAGSSPCPGTLLGTVTTALSDIDTANLHVVTFTTPINITSNYVIGMDWASTVDDAFGLVSTVDTTLCQDGADLAWEKWSDNKWYTFNNASSWGLDIDILIMPVVDMTAGIVGSKDFINGLQLSQNYPNPTQNNCLIEYALQVEASNVILTVYDVTGKVIAQINQGAKQAGNYAVVLDVTNYADGSYFYSLQADKQRLAKRMEIVR